MKKLCYILINFDADTYRHYLYLYEMVERLGQVTDVFLIIENAKGEPTFFKNVREIHCLRSKSWLGRKFELFRLLFRARLKGYRVFYSHYSYLAAMLSGLICRLTRGQSYFWHCMMVEHLLQDIEELSGGGIGVKIRNKIFIWRLRFTLWIVRHLVTGSDFMADYYSRHYGARRKNVVVFPNWVKVERIRQLHEKTEDIKARLHIPPEHKVVLFLHGLVRGKGAHFLPTIVENVCKAKPDVTFIIIGDGMSRQTMEDELHQRRVHDRTRVLGHVPNHKVGSYYALADVFILPSWFDAFTRVILEAMAAGTPFVATDGQGGVRAYTSAKQQEYVIKVDEIDRFPNLVLELLADERKRTILAEEGLRQVMEYTEDKAFDRFVKFFLK